MDLFGKQVRRELEQLREMLSDLESRYYDLLQRYDAISTANFHSELING